MPPHIIIASCTDEVPLNNVMPPHTIIASYTDEVPLNNVMPNHTIIASYTDEVPPNNALQTYLHQGLLQKADRISQQILTASGSTISVRL